MKKLVVAIDGPAGAGKSTIARLVAQKLGYVYIDTGSMYRAAAWKVLQTGCQVTDENIIRVVQGMHVSLVIENDAIRVKADNVDVTDEIRTPEVTEIVSHVARLAPVRTKMVTLQRAMADGGAVVMDGRDIASTVLPNADIKIFLTASIEARAQRRWKEMREKGMNVSLEELQQDIATRDKADEERDISPLVRVPEATLLDSTNLTIDEVVENVLTMCR